MRRILITGATGFIGGHLLRSLPRNVEVITLGRHRPAPDPPVADWLEHDLAESLNYDRLPGGIEAIIHLAQSQVYKQFPRRASEIFEVNINGTFRLLEYARQIGVRQFVFASTGGIYRLNHSKIAETDSIQPLSFYASSKYAAELLMRNYEQFFQVVILRFFFVYGPGQQQGMLIPTFSQKIMNDEPITIEGNPGLQINPIYVTDAVRAIEAGLAFPGSGQFNVAGDDVVTITGLVKLIEQVMGKGVAIQHAPTELDGDLVADTTRMKEVLGVYPKVALVDGLRQTVQR